jgi:hypothetical protein
MSDPAAEVAVAQPPTDENRARKELRKLDLEIAKLDLEGAKLRHETGFIGRASIRSGLASMVILAIGATLGWLDGFRERNRLEEHRLLQEALQAATDKQATPARRVAGIWSLSQMWASRKYDGLLASSLAAILVTDDDHFVRIAAADVIGLGISEETPIDLKRSRVKLLYGSTDGYSMGTVTAHNIEFQRMIANPGRKPESDDSDRLQATREAIRRNWEYLEYSHLADLDLQWAQLYRADLRHAFLGRSNLTGADLFGAKLDDATFTLATMKFANIKDVEGAPEGFVGWALDFRAVEMSQEDHRNWVKAGCPQPKDWESWRKHGWPVDQRGIPVE